MPNRQQNILRAAERLFSVHGFHGVSIRDIAEEAGVPLALVGYYYGPKLDLYQTLFRVRTGYVADRLEGLAAAQRNAAPGALLDEIVQTFVLPVLQAASRPEGRNFLRLLHRSLIDHLEEDQALVRELFDPLAHAFIDALAAALPHARRAEVAWCYQFALGALMHHVSDERIERLYRGENQAGDHATAGPLLVRFIANGLRGVCAAPIH